ncbi:MAG TPA: hypothetical protein VLJ18_10610, partial [Thermoanaerobaculia bacterium]|nr:hypothetical protein [Thermoanaerobaculia bacterium]
REEPRTPDLPRHVEGRDRAGPRDLGLNEHANNVAILRALLTAPPRTAVPPLTFEADFRGEVFEGDVLNSRVAEAAGVTRVLLSRESDGKEVARAVIAAVSPPAS